MTALANYLPRVFAAHAPLDVAAMGRLSAEVAADAGVSDADLAAMRAKVAEMTPRCATARMYAGWLAGVWARRGRGVEMVAMPKADGVMWPPPKEAAS